MTATASRQDATCQVVIRQDAAADSGDEGKRRRLRPPVAQLDEGFAASPVADVEARRRNGVDGSMSHDVQSVLLALLQHLDGTNERIGLKQVEGHLYDSAPVLLSSERARSRISSSHDSIDVRRLPDIVEP